MRVLEADCSDIFDADAIYFIQDFSICDFFDPCYVRTTLYEK